MNPVVSRIMEIYSLLSDGTGGLASGVLQARLAAYIEMLEKGGQTDPERLLVCGLVYLRQLDGRLDPVEGGFSGL